MSVIEPRSGSHITEAEALQKSLRVNINLPGYAYSASGVTGTIIAGQSSNMAYFAIRNSPTSNSILLVDRVHYRFTTIVAFTTVINVDRRMSVRRFVAQPTTFSGGTQIVSAVPLRARSPISRCSSRTGGDIRVASTSGLTGSVNGFSAPVHSLNLGSVGNAGASVGAKTDFLSNPLIIMPGEYVTLSNPIGLDPGGTWQLAATIFWREVNFEKRPFAKRSKTSRLNY